MLFPAHHGQRMLVLYPVALQMMLHLKLRNVTFMVQKRVLPSQQCSAGRGTQYKLIQTVCQWSSTKNYSWFLSLCNAKCQKASAGVCVVRINIMDHFITAQWTHGFSFMLIDLPCQKCADFTEEREGCTKGKVGSIHMYAAMNVSWGNGMIQSSGPPGSWCWAGL